jgi:hypothetical protein
VDRAHVDIPLQSHVEKVPVRLLLVNFVSGRCSGNGKADEVEQSDDGGLHVGGWVSVRDGRFGWALMLAWIGEHWEAK